MRKWLMLVPMLAVMASPAVAEPLQDCNSDDPTLRIRGCSELLKRADAPPADRAVILSRRSDAHLVSGGVDAAIADRREALKLEPEYTAHRNQLSRLYQLRGAMANPKDLDQALSDFSEAISFDPSNDETLAARANIHVARKNYSRAIDDLSTAVKLLPTSADYKQLLAKVYDWRAVEALLKGDLDQVIADSRQAIALNPAAAALSMLNRGIAYAAKKQNDPAITDFSEAIRLEPSLTTAYVRRGELRQARGETAAALSDFDEAIKREPNNLQALILRGLLREEADQREAAIEDYRSILKFEPSHKVAAARLGQLAPRIVPATKAQPASAQTTTTTPIAPSAPESDWEWLRGTWRGEVAGLLGKSGNVRTLVVTSIKPDGTVSGRWAAGDGPGGGGARMRITGNAIVIVTSYTNVITLRSGGPNKLSGIFDNRYRGQQRLPFTMKRVRSTN